MSSDYIDQFEYLTIEPAKPPCSPGEVAVKGYKRCERGVMKGQMLAHFIGSYPDAESAKAAFPEQLGDAEAGPSYHQNSYHHLPDDNDPPVGKRMKPNGEY